MSMKQGVSRQMGKVGETAVILFFEELDWGVVPSVPDHDLGTDMYLNIRDGELRESALMLGVQVKTGNKWFREPGSRGGKSGFWYREGNSDHANYWTNHPIPHILLIQDKPRKHRIWALVTPEAIVSTGKGFKIFIPEDQVLDKSFKQGWINAAIRAQKNLALEGSRWNFSVEDVPKGAKGRYALLVPRLVEPHPNRGTAKPIKWPEALAAVVQADERLWLASAQRHVDVPTADEAKESASWGWRFAAATHSWVYGGSLADLEGLSTTDIGRAKQIAHAILLSVALVDDGRSGDALALLEALSKPSDYSADQGWLSVHMARIHIEAGRMTQGLQALQHATIQLAPVPRDVSVSAVRAAAAWALFEVSTSEERDLSAVVPALDTAASWWRTQGLAYGLDSAAERVFKTWSSDQSIDVMQQDVPHNELFSAALVARLAGSHDQWRSATRLMAMIDLSTTRPLGSNLAESLDLLRRSGDYRMLGTALSKAATCFAAKEIASFVGSVTVSGMTRTTAQADLVAVRRTAQYLSDDSANSWIDFLLDIFENPALLEERFGSRFYAGIPALEALTCLFPRATAAQLERFVDLLLALPDNPNRLLEASLRPVADALPEEFRKTVGAQFLVRAETDGLSPWFRWSLLSIAGPDNSQARQQLHTGLLNGDIDALFALGRYDRLSKEEAAVFLATKAASTTSSTSTSPASYRLIGGMDSPREYAVLATEFPTLADWPELSRYIADPTSSAQSKRNVCGVLSSRVERIPREAREKLLEIVLVPEAALDDDVDVTDTPGGEMTVLALKLLAADDPRGIGLLQGLLAASGPERQNAAKYLVRQEGHDETLAVLVGDSDASLASYAVEALARRVANEAMPDSSKIELLKFVVRRGRPVDAYAICRGFNSAESLPSEVSAIVNSLTEVDLFDIRQRARKFVVNEAPGIPEPA